MLTIKVKSTALMLRAAVLRICFQLCLGMMNGSIAHPLIY